MNDPTSFSDCKGIDGIKFLQEKFGKTLTKKESLFANTEHRKPSTWLNETLEITLPLIKQIGKSEQARSAFVISNIILEFYKCSDLNVSVYTEQELKADGLTGHPDYILARRPSTSSGVDEYKVVIEVKKGGEGYRNFGRNYGQCMAEMIAMQCFNTKNKSKVSNIYGVLTNAETWQFMKLTDDKFQVDTKKYRIDKQRKLILGILDAMISDTL